MRAHRGAARLLRCTDDVGRALAGLQLDLVDGRDDDRVHWLGSACTDAAGRARIAPLDLSDVQQPRLIVRGAGTFELRELSLANDAETAICVAAPGTIEGRVVDALGRPVSGVRVQLCVSAQGAQWVRLLSLTTISDAAGRYRFAGIGAGSHRIRSRWATANGRPRAWT